MTSGSRSGDITETMLVRWRKAARTVAACDVIIGEPSMRALRRGDGGREIADVDGAAGDREQALLRALVEDRLLAADDRQHDRAPEVVAPGRLGDLALLAREHFLVVDLLDRRASRARRFAQIRAGPPQPAALRRVERQQAQQGVDGLGRHVADEREAERCRDRGAARPLRRCRSGAPSAAAPSTISVSGVTPMEKTTPSDESRIAAAKRSTDAPTVGCSGG